jgi:hypothetical protein
MKKYFLIILLLQAFNVFATVPFKRGDVLNVWATQGLPLYNKPETGSKKLITIAYASAVTIIDANIPAKPMTVLLKNNDSDKPFVLKAGWVKVEFNNLEGYVFGGYLSHLPCFKKNAVGFEAEATYLKRIYGQPKVVEKKSTVRKQPLIVTTTTYKSGITETVSNYDSCFDVQLYLTNVTYQEVLLYEQIALFDGDAANDIEIKDLKNGKFELSYNSCD